MQTRTQLLFVIVSFSVLTLHGFAQPSPKEHPADTAQPYGFLTFTAAPTLNLHLASFGKLPGVPSCCPQYNGGIGIGYHLSVGYEWLTSPIGPVHFALLLTAPGATLQQQEVIGNTVVLRGADTLTVDAVVEHRLETSLSALGLSIDKPLPLNTQLEFLAGLQFWYFWQNSFAQQEQLIEPARVTFTNGSRIRNAFDGTIPDFLPVHLVIALGLRFHLPAGRFATLSPLLQYRIGILPLSSVPWRFSQLLAGISYRLPLRPSPPPPVQRDTVYYRDTVKTFIVGLPKDTVVFVSRSVETAEETTEALRRITTIYQEHYEHRIPRLPVFRIAIDVMGIQDSIPTAVDTLNIVEEEIFETLPLLPYIYFGHGDSTLQSTRLHLLQPGEIATFDPTTLPPDPLVLYREILNIIGYRLRQHPTATLTITGCNNGYGIERNNLRLSAARARAIREYLIDRWQIEPQRLQLQWRNLPAKPTNPAIPEGREENARAELSGTVYELFAPLRLRQLQYRAYPPHLLFIGSSVGESKIQRWEFTLRAGPLLLKTQAASAPVSPKMPWQVTPDRLRASTQLQAILTATDPFHQTSTATLRLPIKFTSFQQRRKVFRGGKQIEIFSLILFDFDRAELTPAHLKILEEVRKAILPSSTVKIYGYTDRIGSAAYNRDLARRRCEEVAKILRQYVAPDKLFIYPLGSDHLLYDNDLPEGRAYSRTVRIIIETPLEKL